MSNDNGVNYTHDANNANLMFSSKFNTNSSGMHLSGKVPGHESPFHKHPLNLENDMKIERSDYGI